MGNGERTYCCIDLKSFYASVECVDRGLDPITARLVVADPSRGPGAICLAVSPALKALGVPGRPRVFEIPDGIGYITAPPRMRRYMEVSAEVVRTYLRFVSAEDVHVYSVDECFIDLTPYLRLHGGDALRMVGEMRSAVLKRTGIPATAGVGPNLFLAKVALDVFAKREPGGVAVLDEASFRERVWPHRPITDVWQVGPGTARRLARFGIRDMGGVARADPDLLYREFGRRAEYLIDHAWGLEPCTIADIHAYRPKSRSVENGQVLFRDYDFDEGLVLLREQAFECALELADKGLAASGVAVHVGYSHGSGVVPGASASRRMPGLATSPSKIRGFAEGAYREAVDSARPIRRLSVSLWGLVPAGGVQRSLFDDAASEAREAAAERAVLDARARFGAGAVMTGASLLPCATGMERAHQIGGHHE